VERNILEIKNLLRKTLVMKGFLTIANQSFSKVSEMGKSLLLESDEKEKCTNVKPSYTLPQDVPREVKRMRKILWDEGTCVEKIILAPEIFTEV